MNYIEQIKVFWLLDKVYLFGGNETRLYFYLLEQSNSLYWKNPLANADGYTAAIVGISINTLKTSRNKLQQAGLIRFKSGNRGSKSRSFYEIIPADKLTSKPSRNSSKIDEFSDETLTNSLTNSLRDSLQKVDDNNKQKHKLKKEESPLPPFFEKSESFGSLESPKREELALNTEKEEKEKSCGKKEKEVREVLEGGKSDLRPSDALNNSLPNHYACEERNPITWAPNSLKTAPETEYKLSQGKEPQALSIIEQSMANGWEGLFELKNPAREQGSYPSALEKLKSDQVLFEGFAMKYVSQLARSDFEHFCSQWDLSQESQGGWSEKGKRQLLAGLQKYLNSVIYRKKREEKTEHHAIDIKKSTIRKLG